MTTVSPRQSRFDVGATALAAAVGISRQQVHVYAKEGMPHRVVGRRMLFDVDRCIAWIENARHPSHGGVRAGAGRPRGKQGRARSPDVDSHGQDGADVHDAAPPARAEVDLDTLVQGTNREDRAALATKVTVRQAIAYHKWVAAMTAEHDLAVRQGKFVSAKDVEHSWRRMATDAASVMDDAARRAADEIATQLALTPEQRAKVEAVFVAEISRAKESLAGRKS